MKYKIGDIVEFNIGTAACRLGTICGIEQVKNPDSYVNPNRNHYIIVDANGEEHKRGAFYIVPTYMPDLDELVAI